MIVRKIILEIQNYKMIVKILLDNPNYKIIIKTIKMMINNKKKKEINIKVDKLIYLTMI
jgi:hypothetical protein